MWTDSYQEHVGQKNMLVRIKEPPNIVRRTRTVKYVRINSRVLVKVVLRITIPLTKINKPL